MQRTLIVEMGAAQVDVSTSNQSLQLHVTDAALGISAITTTVVYSAAAAATQRCL